MPFAKMNFVTGCATMAIAGKVEATSAFVQAEAHKGGGSPVLAQFSTGLAKVQGVFWDAILALSKPPPNPPVLRQVKAREAKTTDRATFKRHRLTPRARGQAQGLQDMHGYVHSCIACVAHVLKRKAHVHS